MPQPCPTPVKPKSVLGSAGSARGGDAAVEKEHLAAHLAGRRAAQEHHAVRHLPRLRETAEGGAVDHGVALLRLTTARKEGRKEKGGGKIVKREAVRGWMDVLYSTPKRVRIDRCIYTSNIFRSEETAEAAEEPQLSTVAQ